MVVCAGRGGGGERRLLGRCWRCSRQTAACSPAACRHWGNCLPQPFPLRPPGHCQPYPPTNPPARRACPPLPQGHHLQKGRQAGGWAGGWADVARGDIPTASWGGVACRHVVRGGGQGVAPCWHACTHTRAGLLGCTREPDLLGTLLPPSPSCRPVPLGAYARLVPGPVGRYRSALRPHPHPCSEPPCLAWARMQPVRSGSLTSACTSSSKIR